MSFVAKILVGVVAVTSSLAARSAYAQEDEGRWNRHHQPVESPQRFAAEVRFGPYRPQIDQTFESATPYASTFGPDRRLFFGLEFDWQVLRIPLVGTLGAGFGWGYTKMTEAGKVVGTDTASGEDVFLTLMPMYTAAVLRVDTLARDTVVPLVGYAKVGLGFGLYSMGNDLHTQVKGHTWGKHYALGAMFLLDALDRQAAMQLDNEVGINNSYIFCEWMVADLDGFAASTDRSVLRMGTNTWVLGLAFEM